MNIKSLDKEAEMINFVVVSVDRREVLSMEEDHH